MLIRIRICAVVALLVTVAWVVWKPGFDSCAAAAAALVVVLSCFGEKKRSPIQTGQSQKVSDHSAGIQAGRDAKVKDVKN